MLAMALFDSPRMRRRILIWTVVLAPIAPLAYLGVHFSNPGDPGAATGPVVAGPGYEQPKPAPFTRDNQRAVRHVLKDFISTAVVRHDVSRAWDLAGPSLKEGVSRKEWNDGSIPVVPYPASSKGLGEWSYVQYSYKNTVGLEVFLFPKPGSGYSALTADVELVKGSDRHWRVDYWMPKKFHGPPAVAGGKAKPPANKPAPKRSAPTRSATEETVEPPRASRLWWLLPIGLLSLIVVAPISIALGVWYRNRRAAREYLRSTGRI
jgi:hypothetical protein